MVELGGKGMSPEVSISLFLVFFGGSIEYGLESRNRDTFVAGCGRGVNGNSGLMGSGWSVLLQGYVGRRPHCEQIGALYLIHVDGSVMSPPLSLSE